MGLIKYFGLEKEEKKEEKKEYVMLITKFDAGYVKKILKGYEKIDGKENPIIKRVRGKLERVVQFKW